MRQIPLAVALLLASACGQTKEQPSAKPSPAPAAEPPKAPEVHTEKRGPLSWIEDDYPAALARARAEKKPLFVDEWALWCHTCLSMRSYVFTDPTLEPFADRFVWLGIDTEQPKNAPAVAKLTPEVWPTFYLIDPTDEAILGKWAGSGSAAQMRAFLADGERAMQQAHASEATGNDPLALLIRGDRAAQARQYAEAAALYEQALAKAPADWPRRVDVLSSWLMVLWRSDPSKCLDLGLTRMGDTGNAASAADFAAFAVFCADEVEQANNEKKAPRDPRIEKVRRAAVAHWQKLVDQPAAPLTADDRGDVYGLLVLTLGQLGDKKGARTAAEKRLALLDKAVAEAPDAMAAATYDWARADSYLALGRGDEAIAFLEKREAGAPDDYNPPYWLARVLMQLGRYPDALAAMDRALAKITPPRKGAALSIKATIQEKMGDKPAAAATLRDLIAHYKTLPPGLIRPGQVEGAEKRLAALEPAKDPAKDPAK
jgi:tetratricopeptide (TPR) repeat protein